MKNLEKEIEKIICPVGFNEKDKEEATKEGREYRYTVEDFREMEEQLLTLFSKTIDDVIGEDENTAISYHEALHPKEDVIHEAANASRANMLRDDQRARKKELGL